MRDDTVADVVIIVAGSLSTNALGRAIALLHVAPAVEVEVWGPKSASQWPLASGERVRPLTRSDRNAAIDELNTRAREGETIVVWISKGFAWGRDLVARLDHRVRVIADFDDDDIALAREFTRRSPVNRLRLNPLRSGSPERLRRSQQRVSDRADLFTTSSHTLASALRLPSDYVRVPHAREVPELRLHRAPAEGTATIGFMGTMRPHKGLPEIIDALRGDLRLRLVTFDQPEIRIPEDLASRWQRLEPRTPLSEAYAGLDASVIPMDTRSRGGALQLPAKAIDSAVHGVPIFATPTPVMREFFTSAAYWVDDWSCLGEDIRSARASNVLDSLAASAYERAKQEFSVSIVRDLVRDQLRSTLASSSARQS
jgi:glycosyltransferase involved in cell wall biosynthesis